MKSRVPFAAAVLTLAVAASAQTNRTVALSGVPVIGTTFNVVLKYPAAAANNVYGFMWSAPYAGTMPLSAPGFTFIGDARVDILTAEFLNVGMYDASGTTSMSITLPNTPSLVGAALDCQSIDVDTTQTFYLGDNDLAVVVGASIGNIEIASATTTSLTLGNNDLMSIGDANIGAPLTHGQPLFSYLPIRHRGEEGYVEGFAASFSSTSHNSDIDSLSNLRVSRRTANGAYQVLACPNGFDISVIRDLSNANRFSVLSYERATGTAREVPGSAWIDTGTAPAAQQTFYMGVSKDGQWGALIVNDSGTVTVLNDRVITFRTDGQSAAIDITSTAPIAASYFDGSLTYTNDFLMVGSSAGWMYTSATAPTTLAPLALPNTTATNLPNVFIFSLSARITRDGSAAYLPISSIAASSRQEMDMVKVTNNAGVPLVTNYSQFAVQTGISEFGLNGTSPSNVTNSATGLKASVSPDGSKIAFPAATPTNTVWPGIYVADGTPNPTLRSVPGASFYAEITFINDNTVMFFAGTAVSATDQSTALYSLDVSTGTITQISTATDIRPRGNFFSLNKNWWYFIRSNTASTLNNIVAVDCATGAVHDVTGNEFGGGGTVGTIRTGSFNTTVDPWFALEMQLRRAPVGNDAFFTARLETGVAGTFADANVFRFDIENGGAAVQLTNNTGSGIPTSASVNTNLINIESLAISGDGNHVAYTQRLGTASTATQIENVFHLDLGTNVITQCSVSQPSQTITDGSVRFVGGTNPLGLVWTLGTGTATTVPTANTAVQFVVLGSNAPSTISAPPVATPARLYQVIGTH